ncbi:MAG: M48 family metallopeptidase [Myxococcales bacterium]|jgi:predicted Zn-dependent protease
MRLARFALACLLSTSACATMSKVNRVAADVLMPPSEEAKLGRQMAIALQKQSKVLDKPEVVAYVQRAGNRVAARADNPDRWRFTFTVIDDPKTVNAFAIPGGHIYVYSGLLKVMRDESQLAGVLAHEIAHVTSRHIAKRMVAAYGLQTLSALALGKDPGEVSKIVAALLTQGTLLKNSRDDEREADSIGVVIASRAGYSPLGLVDFLKLLKQMEGRTPELLSFLSDHPATSERIATLQAEIRQKRLTGSDRNAEAFEAVRCKL